MPGVARAALEYESSVRKVYLHAEEGWSLQCRLSGLYVTELASLLSVELLLPPDRSRNPDLTLYHQLFRYGSDCLFVDVRPILPVLSIAKRALGKQGTW